MFLKTKGKHEPFWSFFFFFSLFLKIIFKLKNKKQVLNGSFRKYGERRHALDFVNKCVFQEQIKMLLKIRLSTRCLGVTCCLQLCLIKILTWPKVYIHWNKPIGPGPRPAHPTTCVGWPNPNPTQIQLFEWNHFWYFL